MNIFFLSTYTSDSYDIEQIISNVCNDFKYNLTTIDTIKVIDELSNTIQQEINKTDLVIADITYNNPNILYHTGYAKAIKKPIITLIQNNSDTNFFFMDNVFIYERDRLNETLEMRLQYLFKQPNIIDKLLEQGNNENKNIKTIFISYCHSDRPYLDRLNIHLKPFEKKGLINLWSDIKINTGDKWKEKIKIALDESAIAILLISADFLASDFIIDNELPPILESVEKKGKMIIPVILKPCRFTNDKNLSKFHSINDPKLPLSKMDENGKEEIYVRIANQIDKLIQ